MARDAAVVKKGSGVALEGLVPQAGVAIQLFEELGQELEKFGFSEARHQEMVALHEKLANDRAQAIDARVAAKSATRLEREALSGAKRIRRLVLSAAVSLRADGVISEEERSAFNVGEEIGRSTPKALAYLNKIEGTVERLNGELTPYLGGVDPITEVRTAKAALSGANITQELTLDSLPDDTAEVYEVKGKLLNLIEAQNRAAKRAFDGDALTIGRFNKDLILRATRERKKKGLVETP